MVIDCLDSFLLVYRPCWQLYVAVKALKTDGKRNVNSASYCLHNEKSHFSEGRKVLPFDKWLRILNQINANHFFSDRGLFNSLLKKKNLKQDYFHTVQLKVCEKQHFRNDKNTWSSDSQLFYFSSLWNMAWHIIYDSTTSVFGWHSGIAWRSRSFSHLNSWRSRSTAKHVKYWLTIYPKHTCGRPMSMDTIIELQLSHYNGLFNKKLLHFIYFL